MAVDLQDVSFCPFEVLGLTPGDLSPSEVKSAYRRQALIYHPDKNPDRDTSKQFHQIKEAQKLLLDPPILAKFLAQKKAKMEREQQFKDAKLERQKLIEELERKTTELAKKAAGGTTEKKNTEKFESNPNETELERIIRETKAAEKAEREEEKRASKHSFDVTTLKLKSISAHSETTLRSIFSPYGIVDKVVVKSASSIAFVMFRHRDSCLKALKMEQNNFQGIEAVSTTRVLEDMEQEETAENTKDDPLAKFKVNKQIDNIVNKATGEKRQPEKSLADLEAVLQAKLAERKRKA